MSASIEYQGYRIEICVEEQGWGFSARQWRGSFRFWRDGGAPPRSCTISRTERSAHDARQKTLRVAMSFIRAEVAMEQLTHDLHGNHGDISQEIMVPWCVYA